MRNILNSWRYYSFGEKEYRECMGNIFTNNLLSLFQANTIFAVFAGCFTVINFIMENNILRTGFSESIKWSTNTSIYLATAVLAFLIGLYTNYKMQTEHVDNKFVYTVTTIFYTNVMVFGIYQGVWSNTHQLATIFLCFIICALLMFINPPFFNFFLTLGAMTAFIVATIIVKFENPNIWLLDSVNAVIAVLISQYFNWHISKLRLGLEISANMLEEERNKYIDQSNTDELTQLRNRRDFMHTFQRYLNNYRTSDDWLCISLCDIDFFKFYNDHYGHPMGDECLRGVGRVFNSLKDSMGVYSARVGGEEFALLWFEKDISHVDAVVSYTTNLISNLNIRHEKSKVSDYVTLSMGIYLERCGASNDSKALYDLADKALYAAKESGRNCAIVSGNGIEQYKITPASKTKV